MCGVRRSVGVVWLELTMGTPHVFQLNPDTAARLDAQLRASGRPPGDTQLLHLLRGMTDLCIYPPQQVSTRPVVCDAL